MGINELVSRKVKVLSLAPNLGIGAMGLGENIEFMEADPSLLEKGASSADQHPFDLVATADIIIRGMNSGVSLPELRQLCGNGAKIVLCVTPTEEKELGDDLTSFLSDIWLTPLFPARVRMRLNNLAEVIMETWMASLRAIWLDTLMELIPDMVWIKAKNGAHIKINRAFCVACGKTRKMVEGRDHAYIWNVKEENSNANCANSENRVMESGEVGIFEEVLKIGDKFRKLRTYKAPLRGLDGQIFGTLGIAHDITTLRNLDLELRIFMDSMPFPILMLDDKGIVTHMNNDFLEAFREIGGDLLHASFADWKEWAFERDDFAPGENTFTLTADESMRKIQITERTLRDMFDEVFGHICVFRDVTAENELHDLTWRNAHIDSLTGLHNRTSLYEFIGTCGERPSCIMYIDLDNFKSVNDTYGHETGDEALIAVADLLASEFNQDFIIRHGGDEFMVIIMRPVTDADIQKEIKKLQDGALAIFQSSEKFARLGLSIGMSSSGADINEMIRNADKVMYEVKKEKKNAGNPRAR